MIDFRTAWANTKLVFDFRIPAWESCRQQTHNHIRSLEARGAPAHKIEKVRRDYERTRRTLGGLPL